MQSIAPITFTQLTSKISKSTLFIIFLKAIERYCRRHCSLGFAWLSHLMHFSACQLTRINIFIPAFQRAEGDTADPTNYILNQLRQPNRYKNLDLRDYKFSVNMRYSAGKSLLDYAKYKRWYWKNRFGQVIIGYITVEHIRLLLSWLFSDIWGFLYSWLTNCFRHTVLNVYKRVVCL